MQNYEIKHYDFNDEAFMSWLPRIIGKMKEMKAVDISDEEIQRSLGECVAGRRLVEFAKVFRNAGFLNLRS